MQQLMERQLTEQQVQERQLTEQQVQERHPLETAKFWLDRMEPAERDKVLITEGEIREIDRAAFADPRCGMHDILAEAAAGEIREENNGETFVRGIAVRTVSVLFRPEEPEEDADEAYLTELEAGEPFLAFRFSADRKYLQVRTTCTEGWIRAWDVKLYGSEKTWQETVRKGWESRMLPRPLTPANLLEELFRNYGAGYRFGSRTDCTGYIRTVYERFGLLLPSNSVKQVFYPVRKYDLAGLTDQEKAGIIKGLPLGAVLYMPMHAVVWLGAVSKTDKTVGAGSTVSAEGSAGAGSTVSAEDANGPAGSLCVINAVGSHYDAQGSLHRPRKIMVNSLDLRRKGGETWLSSLTAALIPWEQT